MKLPAPLRSLMGDLIERRLWPAAVLLVVALVAVPVLIRSGGAETPVASVAPGSTPAPGGPAAQVAPATDSSVKAGGGTVRDPFTQPVPPKAKTSAAPSGSAAAAPAASAAGAAAGTTSMGRSGGGSSVPAEIPGLTDIGVTPVGGSTGSTGGSTGGGSTLDARDSWHVDLRFGTQGNLAARSDVPRLSPLPSQADPFFVFLGVLADGKTALFLISSDAQATGDGNCVPSPKNCDRVELKAGETEFFDVATPEGEVVQYQLDLVSVSRKTAASAAVAQAARVRESSAGRQVLRTAVETGQVEVSDLAYSSDLGLVVPSGKAAENGGTLFGGFRVDLRFGAPGALVKRYNLARLTPLPSVESPSFLFLGVTGDGETALFLNPSEAHARGEAVCEPSPEECQRVKLQSGQSAIFDTPTIDGSTTEYQLDVDAITKLQAATAEEAAASRRRESPAGRVILRRLIHEVGGLVADLTFSGNEGTLQPAPPKAELPETAPPGAQPATPAE